MQRSGFSCEICGADDQTLNVHHKRYVHGRKPWEYEDTDLMCLCVGCHELQHTPVFAVSLECVAWWLAARILVCPDSKNEIRELFGPYLRGNTKGESLFRSLTLLNFSNCHDVMDEFYGSEFELPLKCILVAIEKNIISEEQAEAELEGAIERLRSTLNT